MEKYIVEVEKAKEAANGMPSAGPVYRSVYCKDGFPEPVAGIESCWDIFNHAVQKHPHNPMLGQREIINGKAGQYKWLTYQEVYNMVLKIGSALRSCGIEHGGRCGIYGINCPEWIVSMEACNAHGIYCVPLYDTLGADAVEFIIHHAEVSIAIVQEAKLPVILKSLPACVDRLKTLVSFGNISDAQREEAEKLGVKLYSWNDFLSLGEKKSFTLSAPKKTDICTIMYTSGTTGEPKGVLITNENIVTLVAGINHLLKCQDEELSEKDVYISFLPLAHIFDRVIEEYFISKSASIGFWRGDVKLLVEDIAELKPTVFCGVPRVFDRIYSGLNQKISAGGFLSRKVFELAYKYKLNNMRKGLKHDKAATIADKFVFSKVKQGLGGRVRVILSGAAPLARHVEEFLRVVTCCHVVQGYGADQRRGKNSGGHGKSQGKTKDKRFQSREKKDCWYCGDFGLVYLGDNEPCQIVGKGRIKIKLQNENHWLLHEVEKLAVAMDTELALWHNRLGHMSARGMKLLHSKNVLQGLKCVNMDFCEICVYGK